MKHHRNTFRQGDTMISVASVPATIDFADILAATKVVYDEHTNEAPWDACNGYEHVTERTLRMPREANAEDMQGLFRNERDGNLYVVILPEGEDYGIYEYMRARGASRQVAREAVAAERRRTISRIADWYRYGWQWFGIRCTFTILNEKYEDSLWGIDDADFAEQEKVQVALDVAARLERAGYTVTGQPQVSYRENRPEYLNEQNWWD